MNLGANLLPIFSLSESKKAPGVKIAPAARRTPGVFFTVGNSEALIVGISPFSCSTGLSAVTTTLVPFSDSLKISSKAAKIVSVRTKEPATKATPRKTAKLVSAARTLRAQRLLRPRLVKLLLQLHHIGAGLRVEVAGRLVGEDHGRFADQRPGDGDALLLAARELGRAVGAAVL